MRVLVTGGAGYIGSHTARVLAREGIEPVVLDNLTTGHAHTVRWGPFVSGGIGDRDVVRRTLRDYRVEAVIHFAACAYVGESVVDPRKYFRNNAGEALILLEEMLDAGVTRLVFSSSCATYGVPAAIPITEESPQQPVNPYGESKLFFERVLQAYGPAYGLRHVALRYFNAAGADPDGELGEEHDPETHLIPLAIDAALDRRPALEVFGTDYPTPDGTAIRDFIHVDDLADAHVRALRHLCAGGPSLALNLGTGRGYSVREVVASVERVGCRPVPVVPRPRRPGDPPALVANPARAHDLLGWRAHYMDLDAIIKTAWDWRARGATDRADANRLSTIA